MILEGKFRDGHPRATVTLPGRDGPFPVEFVVDTGLEGDLAVPSAIARRLAGGPDGFRDRVLADGSPFRCPYFLVAIADEDGPDETDAAREVEVLVLGGQPLLGTLFLRDHLLQIELAEGGSVAAEPL